MLRVFSALLAILPTLAFAEIVTVPAAGSVPETVEKLTAAIDGAGAKVFAIVNHGAGAESIGEDVGDMQLVIFGNPKVGTPAIAADPLSGLDLPLKVLVYETANGTVLAYEAPAAMLGDRSVPGDAPFLNVMSGALGKLTGAAAE